MATTVVPPAVGAAAPAAPTMPSASAPASDTRSMINADLGIGADPATETPAAGSAAIDPAVADEVNAIPDDEAQAAAAALTADEPEVEAAAAIEDDGERPEIPNLNETRWKKVHGAYKWAQQVGQALGVVGEDGQVDIAQFPSVQEMQAQRSAYSDRIAMEHDFASGDPQNAAAWIENWNAFSPEGMTTVASSLPGVLARQNPGAYQTLAAPVLGTFLDYMYQQGAAIEDPAVRDYILNGARAAEWWLSGGPNGGTYRPDAEALRQASAPNATEQQLALTRRQLQDTQRQHSNAQWGGFVSAVNGKIATGVDQAVDEVLKPLKSVYRNQVGFTAIRNEFISRYQQALKADSIGQRQFDIAVERARRTPTQETADALANQRLTMVKRAIGTVRGKFLSEISRDAKQSSDTRHAQLAAGASKVGPTSGGGAPRPQSIIPALQREKGETATEYQKRMVDRDLGLTQ